MCKTRVQAKCLDGQLLISIYLFAAMHYYGTPHCITKADASQLSHDLSSVSDMPPWVSLDHSIRLGAYLLFVTDTTDMSV